MVQLFSFLDRKAYLGAVEPDVACSDSELRGVQSGSAARKRAVSEMHLRTRRRLESGSETEQSDSASDELVV